MNVKITGFKCHLNSSYVFKPDSLVLLQGDSGAGKTTVLDSILWCLYGSKKIKNVDNNTGVTNKCSVTIEFDDLLIFRQKNPTRFDVIISNPDQTKVKYTGDAAKGIIVQRFGTETVWRSCSYVNQKDRCILLSGNNAKRLEILTELSFSQDKPKEFIDIIKKKIKELNIYRGNLNAVFEAEKNIYDEQEKTRPRTIDLTDEQIVEVLNNIKQLKVDIKRVYQEVLEHENSIGSYNTIKSQLTQNELQLNNLPIDPLYDEDKCNRRQAELTNLIRRLDEQIILARQYKNNKERAQNLGSEIKKVTSELSLYQTQIENTTVQIKNTTAQIKNTTAQISSVKSELSLEPNNLPEVTDEMIWQVKQHEAERDRYVDECTRLNCEYTADSINNKIEYHRQKLAMGENTYNSQIAELTELIRGLDEQIILARQYKYNKERADNLGTEIKNATSQLSRYQAQIENTKAQIENKRVQIENTKVQIENKRAQIENTKVQIENKRVQIENTRSQIENTRSQIENKRAQIENTKAQIENTKAQIENTKAQIENTTNQINLPEVTDEMIWQVTQQEAVLARYVNECTRLNCDYTADSINNKIEYHRREVTAAQNMERNIQPYNDLKDLQQQLRAIDISSINNLNFDITQPDQEKDSTLQLALERAEQMKEQIALELAELRKGLTLLQCPSCTKSLRYVNNKLVPGEREPVTPAEIEEKEVNYHLVVQQLSTIRRIILIQHKIENVMKQLEGVDIQQLENYINTPTNISHIQTILFALTQIEIVEKPVYTSSFLQLVQDYNKLIQQYNKLILERTDLESRTDEQIKKIDNLNRQRAEIQIPDNPSTDISTLQTDISKHQSERDQINRTRQQNSSQIQEIILDLNRIKIIKPSQYTLSFLTLVQDYNKLIRDRTDLESRTDERVKKIDDLNRQLGQYQIPDNPSADIPTLTANISTYQSEIEQINRAHQNNTKCMAMRDHLVSVQQKLQGKEADLDKKLRPTAKTTYESIKKTLKDSEHKYNEALYTQSRRKTKSGLDQKAEEIKHKDYHLEVLERLKLNAIKVEYKQLQDTVDTINLELGNISSLFFNEPIDIELQLYKPLKTKNKVKLEVKIRVRYKGPEYDNINQLSGGEGDRVSLAMVLALNKYNNSRIIMLDECVSSLDKDLKESCINAMRSLDGKTIICVDHETVEAYYDQTIKVSCH